MNRQPDNSKRKGFFNGLRKFAAFWWSGVTAINAAAADAINAATGFFSPISLAEGEKELRHRFAAFGEYPVKLEDGRVITQVFDREAAEAVVSNAGKFGGLALFFKGIPVYEGHPDDPAWLRQNPGHKPDAKARIKGFEVGADGLYATTVFNSEGAALISGEAPKYSAHSPRWRMVPVNGRPNCMRPVLLWSTGLTNTPNIPDSTIALNSAAPGIAADEESQPAAADGTGEPETNDQDDIMKLTAAAMAALGFAPEATPTDEEISTAITALADSKKTTEETATAANSKVIDLQTALDTARAAAVETVINSAIAEGRITEGNKQKWVDALNTDFAGESEKIAKLMPALNTRNQLPATIGNRRAEQAEMTTGVDAINSAVRDFAAEKQIDISTAQGWTRAFEGAKAAKPEIFARK